MENTLVLDYGTTSLKCTLFGNEFIVLAESSYDFHYVYPQESRIEYKARDYICAAIKTIKEVTAKSGVNNVSAISVTGQAETMILLGQDGQPLRPAIVWLDSRASEEAGQMESALGNYAMYEKTGLPSFDSILPVCKLLWLQKREPEILKSLRKVLMLKDYVTYALSGEIASEYSVSSCTGYLNIRKKCWDKELLSLASIAESTLPQLTEPNTCLGKLRGDLTAALGLAYAPDIYNGMLDQCASVVGCGNFGDGKICETTGTVLAVAAVTDSFKPDRMGLPVFCHGLPGKYVVMPNCYTAGILLKWFRDNFNNELAESLAEIGVDFFSYMDQVISEKWPPRRNLIMLPHFCGRQSPVFRREAVGVLYGLTLNTDRFDVAAAIMESVGFLLRENIEALEDRGIRTSTIISLGGGAGSPLWLQMKADITGKTVQTLDVKESTSLGCAYGAMISRNACNEEYIAGRTRIKSTYLRKGDAAYYDDKYRLYLDLHSRLGF